MFSLRNGCVNVCGLTTKNVDVVARAIHDVVQGIKDDPRMPSSVKAEEDEDGGQQRESPTPDK